MAAAIQSVMENAGQGRGYAIYVLHQQIQGEYQALLRKQVAAFPAFSLEFIDVAEYFKGHTFANLRLTVATYYRLIIPYLFGNYKKVIYLDSDVICLADVAGMIDGAPDDAMLSCVRDYVTVFDDGHFLVRGLGMKDSLDYFNAGVLVFNTELFRQAISQKKLLDFAASRDWRMADQDILNVLCQGRTHFLSLDWNVMFDHRPDYVPESLRAEHRAALASPKIIHYVMDKPWRDYFRSRRVELFWRYAERTPFAGFMRGRRSAVSL
jgi:lipopolysaccharide biosynthesis glycosyltransferase